MTLCLFFRRVPRNIDHGGAYHAYFTMSRLDAMRSGGSIFLFIGLLIINFINSINYLLTILSLPRRAFAGLDKRRLTGRAWWLFEVF